MKPIPIPYRQRGAAVVVALLILTLATLVASGFAFRSQVQWRKHENAAALAQARWVLRAAEHWAGAILADDLRQGNADHLGEAWANPLPPVEAEGMELSGRMEDENRRFNLNSLVRNGRMDSQALAVFRRLLAVLKLPDGLAWDVLDWLDQDQTPAHEGSAESDYYLRLNPPYQTPGRALVSVDELIRVRGVDAQTLAVLRPFVTALPESTLVNVNTAAPEVLAALVDGLQLDQAYALAAKRRQQGFRDVAEFRRALPPGLDAPMAATSSQYFLVTALARRDRVALGSRTLLRRDAGGRSVLVWRSSL